MSCFDLKNKRFGKLIVLQEVPKPNNKEYKKTPRWWLCRCDCGTEKVIIQTGLIRKKLGTKSCGCIGKVKKYKVNGTIHYRKLYNIWNKMILRCTRPNQKSYPNYGGRGIQVCKDWQDFAVFYNDMVLSYKLGLTIERINVNGNYEPSNCTWIKSEDQAKNRRTTVWYDGKCLKDVCKERDINYRTVLQRRKSGWSLKEAVNKPVRHHTRRVYT